MTKRLDLVGQTFGKLTVLEYAGSNIKYKHQRAFWKCVCACGNTKILDSSTLRGGKVIGCGQCRTNIGNQHGTYNLKEYDSSFMELFRSIKNSAKNRELEFLLTEIDVRNLTKQRCHYCNSLPKSIKRVRNRHGQPYVYNGIDRVNNSLGYTLDNCVPCCEMCNRMKLAYSVDQFRNQVIDIYKNWADR